MCGNFWKSSHYQQWLLDPQDLLIERQTDCSYMTEEEYQKLMIFFANIIQALGETLKLRQQVIATATVYLKRFYSRNSLQCIDPILMMPTCVYLASKVEEFMMMAHGKLTNAFNTLWKNKCSAIFKLSDFPYTIRQISECEFYLLEVLDCSLIVYQPYRSLTQLAADFNEPQSQSGQNVVTMAWKIINDSLRTDVCLLYAPYIIALGAIYMASVSIGRDMSQWFAELSVNMDKVMEVCKHLMSLYDLLNTYNERDDIAAIWAKVPKPRQTSSSD